MPRMVRRTLAVSASATSVALAAAWRTGDYAVLSIAVSIVLVAALASFTWLRTLRIIDQLGRDSQRLPRINNVLDWEDPPAEQGQLFEFPREERNWGSEHHN